MLIRWHAHSHAVTVILFCVQVASSQELSNTTPASDTADVVSGAGNYAKAIIQDEVRRFELDVKTVTNLAKSDRARRFSLFTRSSGMRNGTGIEPSGLKESYPQPPITVPENDDTTMVDGNQNGGKNSNLNGNTTSADNWLRQEYRAQDYRPMTVDSNIDVPQGKQFDKYLSDHQGPVVDAAADNATVDGNVSKPNANGSQGSLEEKSGNSTHWLAEESPGDSSQGLVEEKLGQSTDQIVLGKRRRQKWRGGHREMKSSQPPNDSKPRLESHLDTLERLPTHVKHKYYSQASPTLQVENDLLPVSNPKQGRELILGRFKQGTTQNENMQQQLVNTHMNSSAGKTGKDSGIVTRAEKSSSFPDRNETVQLSTERTSYGPENQVKKVAEIVKDNVFFPGMSYPNLYSLHTSRHHRVSGDTHAIENTTSYPDEEVVHNVVVDIREESKHNISKLIGDEAENRTKANFVRKDKKDKSLETLEHIRKLRVFGKQDEPQSKDIQTSTQPPLVVNSNVKIRTTTGKPATDSGNKIYNPIDNIRQVLQLPFMGNMKDADRRKSSPRQKSSLP